MAYNKFEINVFKKTLFIAILIFAAIFLFFIIPSPFNWLVSVIIAVIIVIAFQSLFKFLTKTNHKLILFLDSITHSDFSIRFRVNSELNENFDDLNNNFNKVIEAFQRERIQKQEHLQYLNTIVKHVNVGLIAFNIENNNIEFINKRAKSLLDIFVVNHLSDFKKKDSKIYNFFQTISTEKSITLFLGTNKHISAYATLLKLSDKTIKIITLQNIYRELQAKEVETWQKLTSVLKHEIMNSITPITSISETLLNITEEDIKPSKGSYEINNEAFEDIKEGLTLINDRTIALVSFVNAYRNYTDLPQPIMKVVDLPQLIEKTLGFFKIDFQKNKIKLGSQISNPESLKISGDFYLLEMGLINLLKNAIDAVKDVEKPKIHVDCGLDKKLNPIIRVSDNGNGISSEATEKIFIPFFTTKHSGSGIGLSLTKQIMEMHNGSISAHSTETNGTTFTMVFYKN